VLRGPARRVEAHQPAVRRAPVSGAQVPRRGLRRAHSVHPPHDGALPQGQQRTRPGKLFARRSKANERAITQFLCLRPCHLDRRCSCSFSPAHLFFVFPRSPFAPFPLAPHRAHTLNLPEQTAGVVSKVGIFRLAPDAEVCAFAKKQLNNGEFKTTSDVNVIANLIKVKSSLTS